MSAVRKHQLFAFFVLAYALSWAPSPGSVVPLGPLGAAVIVLELAGGRAALADFFRAGFRWRVAPRCYVLALALPPSMTVLAVLVTIQLGAVADASKLPPLIEVLALPLVFFVMVGMGEEFAWRGFALPRLASRFGLLAGALLLGALHVPWHAPLIGTDFSLTEFVPLGVAIVAFSVFTAVLWTRAEGSMLLPALAHVAVNTAGGPTLFQMFGAADRLGLYWAWALLWVVASAAAWLLAAPARLLAPSPALEAT